MKSSLIRQTIQAGALAAGLASIVSVPGRAQPPALGIAAPAQGAWPQTSMQTGRYFTYAAPTGWTVNEATNGVDLTSPDANEGINFFGLEGSPGASTPRRFIERMVQAAGLRGFTITETVNRPVQNGFETAEFLFSYTDDKGRPCSAWAWSAVNNALGRNNAYGELAWATTDRWTSEQQFLVASARLVSVSNPQQAFQRDQLVRMRVPVGPGSAGGFNHPNTFTPYNNSAAMNRISDRNARARRDDTPLVDPSTGRTYHGTSDTYNYVKGGWVNPQNPTQLLQVVPPGGKP